MDLTRSISDGALVNGDGAWPDPNQSWCGWCFRDPEANREVITIVPIIRLRRRKSVVGVNQLATVDINSIFLFLCCVYVIVGRRTEHNELYLYLDIFLLFPFFFAFIVFFSWFTALWLLFLQSFLIVFVSNVGNFFNECVHIRHEWFFYSSFIFLLFFSSIHISSMLFYLKVMFFF